MFGLFEKRSEGGHMYREAYKKASPPVKRIILHFRRLPLKIRENMVLLYYVIRGGTQDWKMDQKDADYKKHPVNDQECGNCQFWYPQPLKGRYICSQVRGDDIRGNYWCRLWKGDDKFDFRNWKAKEMK